MKNVTLRDVAELAGVSQATASLTLNHSSRANFRNGTRERVLVAARQLGYRSPARRKRRTDMADYMLLVMVPTLANPYYVELAQAVEEYAASLGYRVTVWVRVIQPYYRKAKRGRPPMGIERLFIQSFPRFCPM